MSSGIHLSKLDVAKRELEYAIRLFFLSGDPVVVHLVASSAQEILRDLCRYRKIPSFINHMMEMVRDDKKREVKLLLGKSYNFMKHANKDPDGITEFFPAGNEYVLWDSIDMYSKLVGEVTGIMMSFRAWFYAKNNSILESVDDQKQFEEISKMIDLNDKPAFLKLATHFDQLRAG